MKNSKVLMLGSMLGLAVAQNGFCAKLYHVTGILDHVDAKSVILNSHGENYEFDRSSISSKLPANLKAGDSITIYYSMDAKKMSKQGRGNQSAGEVPKSSDKSDDELKKGIIDDDRTFYGA